ncbi:hypothetical protein [Staphylococcus epidermidis]|jgi:hypothetical protein|uniref:hypothetical protein n=1 Tax=Staphylococcus epidermidis TaxID=1282 RepID=UPI0001CC5B4E|nr:hypothetical protein [Staphylococcus epidermidis]MDU5197763.1 hypothetical protein [Enterobacter sichuanensis]DAV80670.1 MAG TPA: hypothetical protein [Caudoviricetes sp.]EFE58278.1 hypothetical protein HMPREF0794_1958 [Staphylococcus epidermidis M23864:W2(grey)]ENL53881.1 hypothetical protein B467_00151 [Staphylococcus epidermidis M0881]MCF7586751.1 hypothetical protein [Staphylococcus epidermidis]
MKAIPKIFDKEKGQWIELMAKPIAEEVVKIMKDDWLSNKKTIDYWLLQYTEGVVEPIQVAIFTDGNEVDETLKSNLEWAFKSYVFNLQNKKLFNLQSFINDCYSIKIDLPKQFKVNATVKFDSLDEPIYLQEIDNMTTNVDVIGMLDESSKGSIEVKYIYNDHPIEEKKLIKENK